MESRLDGETTNAGEQQAGPESGRRARRRAEIRARLIEAGRQIFSRHGVEDATIAQITEAADVGFGTFYLYFPTKEALYRAVVSTGFRVLSEQLSGAQPAEDGDWRRALQAGVSTVFGFAGSNRDLFQLMFAGREIGGVPGGARGAGMRGPLVEWLGMIVQSAARTEYQGNGQALEELVEMLTAGAVAVLRRTTSWWARNADEQDMGMESALAAVEAGACVGRFIAGGLAAAFAAEPAQYVEAAQAPGP